ncbi:MAG: hypothetical protein Q7R87_03140 [Nanoarchaeota archaeon]|nr:hypothetical protein [Nanoarchaeota archaeon]
MNPLKKILVLDSKAGEGHKEMLETVLEMHEMETGNKTSIKIDNVRGQGIAMRLPRDYDGYLLHLSQVETRRDLPSLREEQPWSFIYGIVGQGTVNIVPEIRGCLDATYFVLAKFDYQQIIEDVLKGRERK